MMVVVLVGDLAVCWVVCSDCQRVETKAVWMVEMLVVLMDLLMEWKKVVWLVQSVVVESVDW